MKYILVGWHNANGTIHYETLVKSKRRKNWWKWTVDFGVVDTSYDEVYIGKYSRYEVTKILK